MADDKNDRRDDERLDASLSFLGEDEKDPSIGRIGSAPRPAANGNLEQAFAKREAKAGDGSHDETSERAAKEAMRNSVDDYGKR